MVLKNDWKLYYYESTKKCINTPDELKNSGLTAIPATVPGNVELDLSAAGILPKDLYMGMNILEAEKFETYDWWYETEFTANAPKNNERVILNFGGVDCVAEYFLNGKSIGKSDNMFIEHTFEITDTALYGTANKLYVHIMSPIIHADNQEIDPLELIFSWHKQSVSQVVRKAPHSYGWDIMPRAVGAGIWRDVTIEYKPQYGFDYSYFSMHYLDDKVAEAQLVFKLRLPEEEIFTHKKIRVVGRCNDKTIDCTQPIYSSSGRFIFPIDMDTLWWPRNYGEPNMYALQIEVYDHNDNILFSKKFRQGFRKVELKRSDIIKPDGRFEITVNNRKILAVGSNWVPMDAYHSRDNKRYKKAIELAVDVGCNILRCWGGNVYEDDSFFDLCDENGIMVWQDFAMACFYYPQTEVFFKKLEEEVTAVVQRLRNHASIVLWCGDNEVDQMVSRTNELKPSANRITREILPNILLRLDPKRPYLPSSPYISDEALELGEDSYPENHLWGPRDYYKSDFYNCSPAYFVSETGYHGCPSEESIRKFITPDKVWPYFDNEEWILHSTDQFENDSRVMLMHKQVKCLFNDVPTDMTDYIIASQISQAEADKFFIERLRARTENVGGIIWWNLVDGWPQMSDAVVDYYYDKKLAYYYIKRSSRPVIAMAGEYNNGSHSVLLSNWSGKDADAAVKVTDAATGTVLFTGNGTVKAGCNTELGKIEIDENKKGMFIIEYTANGTKFINTYLYGTPVYNLSDYKLWLEKANKTENS